MLTMANDTDPVIGACLRLASSADAMKAAAKTYLRLAEHSHDGDERSVFLECAAFYAKLAENFEKADREPAAPVHGRTSDGHW